MYVQIYCNNVKITQQSAKGYEYFNMIEIP